MFGLGGTSHTSIGWFELVPALRRHRIINGEKRMKTFIAFAAVAALLAGASIAQADDNPAKTPGEAQMQSGKAPAGTPNTVRSTTGSGAMAPTGAADPANTPGVKGSKPYTPDTKAK